MASRGSGFGLRAAVHDAEHFADGKVTVNEPWQPETSRFAPVIAAVIERIEAALRAASGG